MSHEEAWKAAHRLGDAADRANRAADRIEEASQKLAHMFEPGYGGAALRLIELLDGLEGARLVPAKAGVSE